MKIAKIENIINKNISPFVQRNSNIISNDVINKINEKFSKQESSSSIEEMENLSINHIQNSQINKN